MRRDFAIARSYPLSLLLRALGPVLSSTLIFFLGRVVGSGSHYLASYGGDYFTFALLGMAAFGLQSLPITSFSGAVREAQLTGTLEAMMATPLPFPLMLVGSALWSVLLSVLEMILLLLIGLELFHLQLHHPLWTLVVLALLLSLLSTGGLALLDAAFLLVFKRGAPTTIALGYATNLLGGVLYPIAVLPVPLRLIAGLLPVTHSANMLRFSLEASNGSQALFEGIALAALTALYLSAGLLAVSLALRVVRAESTLGQY